MSHAPVKAVREHVKPAEADGLGRALLNMEQNFDSQLRKVDAKVVQRLAPDLEIDGPNP